MKRAVGAYRLRRTALAAIALLGFFGAMAATSAAIEVHADAGVVIDSTGRVEAVSPTGFAWRDGIRPGQRVIRSSKADAEDGWSVVTEGPSGPIISREAPVSEALSRSLLFALVALAAGCLAVAFLRLNRAWVLPAASLSLVGASAPLFLANQGITGIVMVAAALVPTLGLAERFGRHRGLAIGIVLAAVALAVGWTNAYFSGAAMDVLEETRRGVALGGTGVLMADRAVRDRPMRLTSPQTLLVAIAGLLISGGLVLVYFMAFPAPIISIAIGLALLAVLPLRSALGRRLELALMADLRQQVAADVAEEERGRLARELHDAPLQELAAVIRRLELVPEARDETPALMAIADQLRTVAIDLRPPMLDDIGLAAALDFLAEEVNSPGTVVAVDINDQTGLERASRPPAVIEFAIYRIAREAVTNALRHASAGRVSISGRIAIGAIDLAVSDDGVGMRSGESRRASGRGRLGLASMRRRAQAIGAELSIDGDQAGTRVSVSWRA